MKKYVLFLFLSTLTVPIFAYVTASLNTRLVASGQPFQLTVSSNTDNKTSPNITQLNENFIILGESIGQSIRSINGHTTKNHKWVYTIQARSTLKKGDKPIQLVIPRISIGNDKSQPQTITLTAPVDSFHNDDNSIQITSSIEKKTYHVQQEIRLKIKIIISPAMSQEIQSAALSHISIPDVIVKELGKPRATRVNIKGKLFLVTTITYVLFPQKSGLLNISPQTLTIHTPDHTKKSNHRLSQFGFNNSMFQATIPLHLVTKSHQLNILPIPSSYRSPWIPASGLTLSQTITPPNTKNGYQTGDIIQRKIIISATGLLGTQIPNLMENFKIINLSKYPKPTIFNTTDNSGTIIGKRIENISYIANKPGTYILPAINITWWDTKTNKLEIASLSKKIITVMGDILTNNALPSIKRNGPITKKNISRNQSSPNIKTVTKKGTQAYYITAALVLLLSIALFIILARRKKNSTPPKQHRKNITTKVILNTSINAALRKLIIAFNSRITKEIYQTLCEISKQLYPKKQNPYHVLCNQFSDNSRIYLVAIECYLYSPSSNVTEPILDRATIKNILKVIKRITRTQENKKTQTIPSLYPDN